MRAVAAGVGFTCFLAEGGQVHCAGGSEISTSSAKEHAATGFRPTPIDLGPGNYPISIAAGDRHVCVGLTQARVMCWGDNSGGQLGLPSVRFNRYPAEVHEQLSVVDLGPDFGATRVAAGGDATCAISDAGGVKCWGLNLEGRLGVGDDRDRGKRPEDMGSHLPFVNLGKGRTARELAMGRQHTCAILDNARVKCWGAGRTLGLGDGRARGGRPNEMGDHLPYVDLGTGRTAVAISANSDTTCAILDNGAVKCWGWNWQGKLGLVRDDDAAFRGDRPKEMGDNLPMVDLGTDRKAKAIAVDYGWSCAVLDTGQIKCWGYDYFAGPAPVCCTAPPELMGDRLPAVNLGTVGRAIDVGSGGGHACAIFEEGRVKCWGSNSWGELGIGDTAARFPKQSNMGDALPFVGIR